MLEPIKPVRHSVITDDNIAVDAIQNENWQYFIETILKTCQTNSGGINNTVELKNIKFIKILLKTLRFVSKHIKIFTIKYLSI